MPNLTIKVSDDIYESVKKSSRTASSSLSMHVTRLLLGAMERYNSAAVRRKQTIADIEQFENALEPDFLRYI